MSDTHTGSVSGFVGEGGVSLDEAKALQAQLLEGISTDAVSDKINAAARLMMSGRHQDCISAYTAIMTQHPDERGTCESQIGACLFFLKDYDKAIAMYESAQAHGADAGMMKDNIDEARDAMRARDTGVPTGDEGEFPVLGLVLLAGIIAAVVYFVVR